jgi:GNAT superfamily N-acetyltransferase
MPDTPGHTSWRLRGMATLAQYRGRGLGRQLAQRCVAYAQAQGATLIWCTSRLATVPFYRRLSFEPCSEAFRLPEFSDTLYIRMKRALR